MLGHSYLSSTADQKEKGRGRERKKEKKKREGKNNRQVPTLINSDVPWRVGTIDLSFALIIGEDDIEKQKEEENFGEYR